MSIDLAVWEGPAPASDDEAARTFDELYERYVEADEVVAPTETIAAYVSKLLAYSPDLTELDDDAVDDSPWADGPMINNARGSLIYFGMVANEAADDAWSHAVATAKSMGLVCFDPQSGALAF